MIRHSSQEPCAVCGGHADLSRGAGRRCYGFRSDDGLYGHCTRPEYAGDLEIHGPSGTYAHRLGVSCRCGTEHGAMRDRLDQPAAAQPIPTAADRQERARAIWAAARPAIGTIAERYLRGRVITIPPPSTLRFARLWHAPSREELPAMIARVDNVCGEFVAIHRIYLRPDGSGRVDKRMLGPVRGGAVRLASSCTKLALTEGIETGLSVMEATEINTWAALSTAGLRTIDLPALPMASEVIIFADRDQPGLEAAEVAGRRLVREGRRVRIARPPECFGDFNDVLRGVG